MLVSVRMRARVSALALACGLSILGPAGTTSAHADDATDATDTTGPAGSTDTTEPDQLAGLERRASVRLRVASFNVLGHGHTVRSRKWAGSHRRMRWAIQLIRRYDPSIVGLQEFQKEQLRTFNRRTKHWWGVWPGLKVSDRRAVQNSVTWRRDDWRLMEGRIRYIPYFGGKPFPMTYVRLKHRRTSRQVWVYNSHNPADRHGNAARWRARAVQKEIVLVRRLRRQYPWIPVLNVGDKNDREKYLCRIMRGSELRAANGGRIHRGRCITPRRMKVDWILGSRDVSFSRYRAYNGWLVQKTTDHPLVVADAVLRR